MSRPGITYHDVSEVADDLLGQGVNPTIELIRRKLGTGSSTTISNHLREWKGRIAGIDLNHIKEKVPQDLMAIVKSLWEKVVDQSQEKIETIEAKNENRIAELKIEVEKYKKNNQRWQQLYYQWIEEKENLEISQQALEDNVREIQKTNELLEITQKSLSKQLEEKDRRIQESQKLHDQAQKDANQYRRDILKQVEREQALLKSQRDEAKKSAQTNKQMLMTTRKLLSAAGRKIKKLERVNADLLRGINKRVNK